MDKCPFTELSIPNYQRTLDIFYEISYNGQLFQIHFCGDCFRKMKSDPYFAKNKHIIAGLILNEKLGYEKMHWDSEKNSEFDLKKHLKQGGYPASPKEKLDNLLVYISQESIFDGAKFEMHASLILPFWYELYFINIKELFFYLGTLDAEQLIRLIMRGSIIEGIEPFLNADVTLTYNGLSRVAELEAEGKKSDFCFIAMSFSPESLDIREAIKEACLTTKHKPILIDEEHIDSHQTINDAIIANLKKSKFCIADFTEQKDGVYFESGFALGQGKKVIYTCRKDWFEKSHFDTNHFPHIIYETHEELKQKLIDKIQAWV